MIGIVTQLNVIKDSLNEKCLKYERKYSYEKEKHYSYKSQLVLAVEEHRVSQEEVQKLLNNLSTKIEEENELRRALEVKQRTIETKYADADDTETAYYLFSLCIYTISVMILIC